MKRVKIYLFAIIITLIILCPVVAKEVQKVSHQLDVGIKNLERSNYPGAIQAFENSLDFYERKGDREGQGKTLLWLAKVYTELRDPDNAIARAKEAVGLFDSLKNKEQSFKARTILADAYFEREKIREARLLIEKLEKEMKQNFSKKTKAEFFLVRGKVLWKHRKFDLALKNFETVIDMGNDLGDNYLVALGLQRTALLYMSQKKYDKAGEVIAKAQEKASLGDRVFLMGLMMETGSEIKYNNSRYNGAKVGFLGALGLYKACGNLGREIDILLWLSDVYLRTNNFDKSKEYANKAYLAGKSSGNVFEMLKACGNLLTLAYLSKNRKDVEDLHKKYLETANLSKDPGDKGNICLEIGKTSEFLLSDFSRGVSQYQKALEIFTKTSNKNGEVKSLMNLGMTMTRQGKYDEAEAYLLRGFKIRESIENVEEYDDKTFHFLYSEGTFLRRLGDCRFYRYSYQKAIDYYQQAAKKHSSQAQTINRILDYNNLLKAALAAHNIDLAEKTLKNVMEDIPKLKEPEARPIFISITLMNMFQSAKKKKLRGYNTGSRFSKDSPARILLQRVYGDPRFNKKIQTAFKEWIDNSIKKKDIRSEMLARLFLGYYYVSIEKYSEAQNCYQKAMELTKNNNIMEAESFPGFFMIDLYIIKGNLKEASNLLEQQITLIEKTGDLMNLVSVLNYQGYLKRSLGEFKESLKCYNKSLKISKKIKNKGTIAKTLQGRSRTYTKMKKYDDAIKDLDNACKLVNESDDAIFIALCNADLGENYAKMRDLNQASQFYKKSFSLLKKYERLGELRDVTLEFGDLLEKENRNREALDIYISTINEFLKVWEKIPPSIGSVKLAKKSPVRKIFNRVVNLLIKMGKHDEALRYLEMSKSAELVNNIDVQKIGVKDEKVKELLTRAKRLKEKMSAVQEEINAENNRKKKESLTKILADTKQDFFTAMNEIKAKNPDFDQLLSVRGTDLAALQNIIPDDVLLVEYYPSEEELYIFLVTKESLKIKNVIVSRKRLYELIKNFRKQFTDPDNIKAGKAFQANRDLLNSLLIEPIEGSISKKKEIVIIPGGLLWYLPMEILGAAGKPSFIEKKQVSYISSADILKLVRGKKKISHREAQLAAFGNPTGADLEGSSEEVKKIGQIFSKSKVFTGDHVTKKNIINEAPKSLIIHIASHGVLNKDDVNKSYIQLSKDNPKLYLGEIYGIPLKDSSLVTLSACQSALGEDNPGREFASLASAFTTAGASSVIASLWEVDDEATAVLFEEFYKNLKAGKTRSESLRLAKLKLISNPKTSHPYFWGAFILLGDWR